MASTTKGKVKGRKDEKKKDVKAIVDSSSPVLPLKAFYNVTKIREDYDRVMEIHRENLRNLERLNRIHGSRRFIDNISPKSNKDTENARIKSNLKKAEQYERENKRLYEKISKVKSILPTCEQLKKDWNNHSKIVKLRLKMPITPIRRSTTDQKGKEYSNVNEHRPLVFMDLAIKDGKKLGRMIAVLFIDIVPKTVSNFIRLCENETKNGSYKGKTFRRIFSDLYAEVAEIKDRNGCDDGFMPENFLVDHNHAGTLAMFPNPAGKVNSAFTISFRPLETLNGRRVAFGRIVKGQKILQTIETFGTEYGKPKSNIIITNCGLFHRK